MDKAREISRKPIHRLAASVVLSAGLMAASPAIAGITCNRDGDCWHTEKRITYPNATFTYHDDTWWDAHGADHDYRWHEADKDHDWHHGYWLRGEWHRADLG